MCCEELDGKLTVMFSCLACAGIVLCPFFHRVFEKNVLCMQFGSLCRHAL